jgi:chemotaxis protein MotB
MARKKKPAEHENHERWLVSYADFITLLFAFFVVMFASSQTDKAKAKQVSEAVQQAFASGASFGVTPAVAKILGGTVDDKGQGNAMMKGPGGAQRANKDAPPDQVIELMPSLQRLSAELAQEVKAGKLQVNLEPRGLVISLRQAAFFPSGTDEIDPKTYPIVGKLANVLNAIPNPVRLEGHTDSVPIHNQRFRSNWDLSAARSISMLDQLTSRFGIPRERCAITAYAETSPVDSNETPEGRAKNRRVDVVILNMLQKTAVPNTKPQPSHAEAGRPKPSH